MTRIEDYDGARGVKRYWLGNVRGMEAAFLERGAAITTLTAPDRAGVYANAVVELKDYDEYLRNNACLGLVPGRFANRIGGARFSIDGTVYSLPANDGANCLHGGDAGFSTKDWKVVEFADGAEPSITFEYMSADGEAGFPGTVVARVTYSLSDDDALTVRYRATTDKPTHVNLTQHSYFNLSGNFASQDISGYAVRIDADSVTESDKDCIPTGKILPVAGTAFDLRTETVLRTVPDFWYDVNYVLNGGAGVRFAAEVYDSATGRVLTLLTDYPGVQFYTGNWLDGSLTARGGAKVTKQSALCLETQFYPDTPNKPGFPSTLLRPGDVYEKTAVFKFSVR